MREIQLILPTELYNLLQQKQKFSLLSDPTFMLLLDSRSRQDYDESHITTSKFISYNEKSGFRIPFGSDIDCKSHVVVYDSNTKQLNEASPAIELAHFLWEFGSRNSVKVLKGGYEDFSRCYPFLRSQQILYTPRELDIIVPYPMEILPGKLYMGELWQISSARVRKHLGLKSFVCIANAKEINQLMPEVNTSDDSYHVINFDNVCESTGVGGHFRQFLRRSSSFISINVNRRKPVLVASPDGLSRAPSIVIAYLIQRKIAFQKAFDFVRKCKDNIQPNTNFIKQLKEYEEQFSEDISNSKRDKGGADDETNVNMDEALAASIEEEIREHDQIIEDAAKDVGSDSDIAVDSTVIQKEDAVSNPTLSPPPPTALT